MKDEKICLSGEISISFIRFGSSSDAGCDSDAPR